MQRFTADLNLEGCSKTSNYYKLELYENVCYDISTKLIKKKSWVSTIKNETFNYYNNKHSKKKKKS